MTAAVPQSKSDAIVTMAVTSRTFTWISRPVANSPSQSAASPVHLSEPEVNEWVVGPGGQEHGRDQQQQRMPRDVRQGETRHSAPAGPGRRSGNQRGSHPHDQGQDRRGAEGPRDQGQDELRVDVETGVVFETRAEPRPAIALRNAVACATESARKSTQPTETTSSVYTCRTGDQSESIARPAFIRSTTRNTPWKRPQAANVQLAPCHRPHRKKTRHQVDVGPRPAPQRLPPSGMYR